jgi:hypothetical protein
MNGIIRAFTIFRPREYQPIAVDEVCVAYMVEAGYRALLRAWKDLWEQPISMKEVHIALRKVGKNKAPGSECIGLEFHKAKWTTIQDDIAG